MKLETKQILQNFKPNKLNIILILSFLLIILLMIVYFKDDTIFIKQSDYKNLISQEGILNADITLKDDVLYIHFNGRNYAILKDLVDIDELGKITLIKKEQSGEEISVFSILFIVFISIILIYMLEIMILRKRNRMISQIAVQKSNAENFGLDITPVISNVKFKDVAGISEVKDELIEIVDFLKNPEKYKNFGVKLPKGVLMIGPPGVGKTLIAKAVAGEAGVPFFYQSGASFAEIFVGVGAKRVRELFAKAKAVAPSIIFIDEIDAVGKTRAKGRNDELESTLNQLLTEMDGFKENNGVIVIAATNKAEMIDTALLRAGRFDRRILIALPNFADRVEILKVYLKDKNFIGDVAKIAGICVGFSGASIATLVNEAAINAMRRNSEKIELCDFEAVKSKVLLGSKKTIALSDYEKEIQSYYQASKALTAFWFNVDFEKIGLLDEKFLNFDTQIDSKTKIINEIKVLLSGVAGLKIYKNDAFSNGSKDIKKAAFLAEKMIFDYAMGDNLIPNEREITDILENSYNEVSELLKNKGDELAKIAKRIFVYEFVEFKFVGDTLLGAK